MGGTQRYHRDMRPGETQHQIGQILAALIARYTGVRPDAVERDTSLWERFPTSGTAEHPSVTSFVEEVHSTFGVYLTEEEWENPTLERLAQRIYAKRTNPEKSVEDWHRERAEIQKGGRVTFILGNLILGPMALLSAEGSWSRRLWVTFGLLLVVNGTLLLDYRRTARRFRSRAGEKPFSPTT